jgi:hypothetical protein
MPQSALPNPPAMQDRDRRGESFDFTTFSSVSHPVVQVAAATSLEASMSVPVKGGDAVAQEAENGKTASKVHNGVNRPFPRCNFCLFQSIARHDGNWNGNARRDSM